MVLPCDLSRFCAGVASVGMVIAYLLLGIPPVHGQFPQPKLDDLFPAVIQRGTEQELRLTGTDLEEAHTLWCSESGIAAAPKILPANELREFPEPEPLLFRVRVDRRVALGCYDVHAVGRFGLSGRRRLCVVDQEVVVPTPSTDRLAPTELAVDRVYVARAQANLQHFFRVTLPSRSTWTVEVDCERIDSRMTPCLVVAGPHGQEIVHLRGDRQQHLYAELVVQEAGPYAITLFDSTYRGGNDYPYALRVHQDPRVIAFDPPVLPSQGSIKLRALGYRLQSEVDSLPAALQTIALELPASTRQATYLPGSTSQAPPLWSHAQWNIATEAPAPLLSELPIIAEASLNDTPQQATLVSAPATIAGTFSPAHDVDWYTFVAKSQEEYDLQVVTPAPGERADPVLVVCKLARSDQGEVLAQEIARVDDVESKTRGGWQFGALHPQVSDPSYRLKCDSDGTYAVCVYDTYNSTRGEPQMAYRLNIQPAQATYQVTVLPAAIQKDKVVDGTAYTVRRGGSVEIPIRIHRSAGADKPLRVWAVGLPPGATCTPLYVAPSQNDAALVVSVDESAGRWHGMLQVAFAPVDSPESASVSTEEGWPSEYLAVAWGTSDYDAQAPVVCHAAGLPLALVDTDTVPVTVRTPRTAPTPWTRGTVLEIPVTLVRHGYRGPVEFSLLGLPDKQFQVSDQVITGDAGTVKVTVVDASPPASGWYNLQLQAKVKHPYARNPQAIRRAEQATNYVAGILAQRKQQLEQAATVLTTAESARTTAQQTLDALVTQMPSLLEKKTTTEQAVATTWKQWQEQSMAAALDAAALKMLANQLQTQTAEFSQAAQAWLDAQQQLKTLQEAAQQTATAFATAEANRAQLAQGVDAATQELDQRNKQLEEIRKANAAQEVEFTIRTTTVPVQLQDAPAKAT